MKKHITLLVLFLFRVHLEAVEESVLSTSPDGTFELVAIKDAKTDCTSHVLRSTKTKAAVVPDDDFNDYLNPGSGSPSLEWSPKNSRLLIISAQIYRHARESSSVFRITDDSKLVYVPMPEDAIPAQWNTDGTIVLLIRHEDVYRFDGSKGVLEPVKGKKAEK